jgi:hypothetical protein
VYQNIEHRGYRARVANPRERGQFDHRLSGIAVSVAKLKRRSQPLPPPREEMMKQDETSRFAVGYNATGTFSMLGCAGTFTGDGFWRPRLGRDDGITLTETAAQPMRNMPVSSRFMDMRFVVNNTATIAHVKQSPCQSLLLASPYYTQTSGVTSQRPRGIGDARVLGNPFTDLAAAAGLFESPCRDPYRHCSP